MKRLLLASAGIHAALLSAALAVRGAPARVDAERPRVDFDLVPFAPRTSAARLVPDLPPPMTRPSAESARSAVAVTSRSERASLPAARGARVVAPSAIAPEPQPLVLEPSTVITTPGGSEPVSQPAPSASAARIDVGSLFAGARAAAVTNESVAAGPPRGSVEDRTARARTAAQGYVNELLANANVMEPAQVHAYYGALSRRMRETWRPGFYRTPTMVDALLAAPRRMANVVNRYRDRASTFTMTGRPDDPARPMIPTDFEDRSGYSTVTTSTIVEVEQDETGRVTSVRVVRSARVHDFDAAALVAVRAAFPQQDAVHLPGGRRSRWAFDVVASRDAIVPIAGMTFNESNGFFEMHYPGAVHVRTRVRPVGSRPLGVPWPAPPSENPPPQNE